MGKKVQNFNSKVGMKNINQIVRNFRFMLIYSSLTTGKISSFPNWIFKNREATWHPYSPAVWGRVMTFCPIRQLGVPGRVLGACRLTSTSCGVGLWCLHSPSPTTREHQPVSHGRLRWAACWSELRYLEGSSGDIVVTGLVSLLMFSQLADVG